MKSPNSSVWPSLPYIVRFTDGTEITHYAPEAREALCMAQYQRIAAGENCTVESVRMGKISFVVSP